MNAFITVVHVVVCLALISVVLLQHGKGADIGAAFGGGASNTVFGARGAGNFLTKMTTAAAVIFMITALTLSYFSGARSVSEIIGDTPAAVQPLPESSFPEAPPIAGDEGEAPSGFEAIPAPEPAPESAPEE